jgi:hypothetical protein
MIDEQSLDTALDASRPEVTSGYDRVNCARLSAIRARTSRRWPWRVAVAGIAGGVILGAGAAAAATVGLPFVDHGGVQNTQSISNGDRCYQGFWISPNGGADPAAVIAAKQVLKTLDLNALDLSGGLDAQRDYEWAGEGHEPDHEYIKDSQDTRETVALSIAITKAVGAELTAQGYDLTTVGVGSEFMCDDIPKATDGE